MAEFVEESAGDDHPVDTARGKAGRCVKRLHHHTARGDGVVNHHGDADSNDGCEKDDKELEADPQT